jgi:leader peptidase (prepilin peptidase) / N-methyltransferase
MHLAAAAEVLGAVPVGWASAWAARRLDEAATPSPWAIIVLDLAIAISAVVIAPERSAPVLLIAGWSLGLLATVDLFAFRLPDLVTLPLGFVGLLVAPWVLRTSRLDHLIGAAAGYGTLALIAWSYARLRGREGLGVGDAKLLAVGGAWLGWIALPVVVVLACAGGLAWAALRLLRGGRAALSEPIAFGVPLSAAIWVCLLLAASGGGPMTLTWPAS